MRDLIVASQLAKQMGVQVEMLQEMHNHLYAVKKPLPLPQPVRFCPWQLNVK